MLKITLAVNKGVATHFKVGGNGADKIPGAYVNYFQYKPKYSEIPPVQEAIDSIVAAGFQVDIDTAVTNFLKAEADRLNKFTSVPAVATDPRLYDYQKDAVVFALQHKHYNNNTVRLLLADDPRLGKSAQALQIYEAIKEPDSRVLILCPKPLVDQWVTYVETWCKDEQPVVIAGSAAVRRQALATAKVAITNWETINMACDADRQQWFMVIGDEAHRLKNRNSKTSRSIKRLQSKHMLLLSGTFVENMPDEWFNPLNIVAPKKFSSYWRWLGHYCSLSEDGYGVTKVAPKDTHLLKAHAGPYIIQRRSDDTVNMPKRLEELYASTLEPWHKAFYDKVKKETVVQLSQDKQLLMPNMIARLARLRQAAIHPLLLDPTADSDLQTGKLAQLVSILDNVVPPDDQVLVYSNYIQGCQLAAQVLVDYNPFVYAGGGADPSNIVKFQHGQFKVMCATPGKGGVGLNLYNANWCIFLDLPWSTVQLRQAAERVRAVGKTGPVYIIYMYAKGTIDSYVKQLVDGKLTNASEADLCRQVHTDLQAGAF